MTLDYESISEELVQSAIDLQHGGNGGRDAIDGLSGSEKASLAGQYYLAAGLFSIAAAIEKLKT